MPFKNKTSKLHSSGNGTAEESTMMLNTAGNLLKFVNQMALNSKLDSQTAPS